MYLARRRRYSTPTPTAALSGIRVLDLSRVLAVSFTITAVDITVAVSFDISQGPYCAQILADYGADVIKVEDVEKGVCYDRYHTD